MRAVVEGSLARVRAGWPVIGRLAVAGGRGFPATMLVFPACPTSRPIKKPSATAVEPHHTRSLLLVRQISAANHRTALLWIYRFFAISVPYEPD